MFADDTASDIRDEWRDAILDGLSPQEATARLQGARTLYQDLGAAPSVSAVDEALTHATSVSA